MSDGVSELSAELLKRFGGVTRSADALSRHFLVVEAFRLGGTRGGHGGLGFTALDCGRIALREHSRADRLTGSALVFCALPTSQRIALTLLSHCDFALQC